MQIVVLDGKSLRPEELDWSGLKAMGTLSVYDRTDLMLVAQRLRGADAVFTNKVRLSKEQLKNNPNLKFIGVLATGYDVVDIKGARELGIPVCNVPGYATEPVAQAAIGLMLELTLQLGYHNARIHQGEWTRCPDFCWWEHTPVSVYGKTMGIVGCGAIGRRVAEIAKAMGMEVIGYNPHKKAGFAGKYVSLETVLTEADVISLHCPAKEDTVGFINEKTIGKMKDGVLLINTGRGSLIQEKDVAEALISGKLGGYAADVVSSEPINVHNPLLKAPNCVLSGHCAWATKDARQQILDVSVANLKGVLEGNPIHVVN